MSPTVAAGTPTTLQLHVGILTLEGYGGGMALPAMFEELDETPLARSPIVTVVWQVRFEEHPTLIAPQTALRLQELLGGPTEFSLTMLPRISLSVQAVGPVAVEGMPTPAVGATGGGWRLSSADGSWHVNVEAGSVSVESSSYGSWAGEFSPRFQRVLQALEAVGPPVVESRLGLRYINILVGSVVEGLPLSAPGELGGLIAPWLLGPLNEQSLQDFVQMAQGRVAFRFDHARTVLNHGVVSAENGELGYLVDIDVFREGGRAFQVNDILAQSEILHHISLGLFQASLKPEILESMRSASTGEGA
jgi:uncharacterized protein (TIGR04255 family)